MLAHVQTHAWHLDVWHRQADSLPMCRQSILVYDGYGVSWHQAVPCAQALSGGPDMPGHLFTGGPGSVGPPMASQLPGFSPELLQQQASLLGGGLTPATSGDGRSPLQVRRLQLRARRLVGSWFAAAGLPAGQRPSAHHFWR